MATVGSLVVKIGTDISGLEAGLNSAQGRLRSFGSNLKSIGSGLTLGITAPVVGIAAAALKSAAGFEQSMNLMQAMTSATAGEMQGLQAQALELGRTTSFSAGDAAGAMLELSKAGMTVAETGAAIPGVLDLAAAGGIDLASAATITANAINTFGLEASAATAVANSFATAANASSADVSDLAQGFAMAGAVFASNGQSVDDLAASLAILSNNGIAGSDAGTSLKVMMMRLAAPTGEAAAAMEGLGLSIYDSTGAMIPFGDVVAQLETATAGLSDAQRNAALATIFGADAIRAATILAGEGGDSYTAMMDAVTKEGAAALLAQAQMQGLGGAVKYFKGTLDSLLISTAMPFMQTLAGMVRGAADLLTQFTTLPAPMQRFAAVLLGVLAVGGPLLVILGTMATAIAALLSPIGLVIAGVVILASVVVANWGTISAAVTKGVDVARPALESLVETMDRLRSGDLTFADIGAGLVEQMQTVPGRIQAWAGSVDWAGIMDSAGNIGASIQAKVGEWLGAALDVVDWAAGMETAGSAFDGLRNAVMGRIAAIDWAGGLESAAGWVETLRAGLAARVNSALETAATGLTTASASAGSLATQLSTSLGALLTNASAQVAAALSAGGASVMTIKDAVVGWFAGLTWEDVAGRATTALETMKGTVNGWRDQALSAATNWVNGVDWSGWSADLSGFLTRIADAVKNIDFTQVDFLGFLQGALLGPLGTAFRGVQWVVSSEDFGGFRDSLLNAVAGIDWAGSLGALGSLADAALESVTEAANSVISGLIGKITGIDWAGLSLDFAGLLGRVGTAIGEIDWSSVGASIGASVRSLFVGQEGSEGGGLLGLAQAVYDAILAIQWGEVLGATGELLASLGTAVFDLVGGAIASLFGAELTGGGTWVAPQWVSDLIAWLPQVPDWVTTLIAWVAALPDWVTKLTEWMPTIPEWVQGLFDWSPSLPDWVNNLLDWSPGMPDWVSRLLGWFGGGGDEGNNATGTPAWPGGWTQVGEFGPELVRLPAGSQIFDHRESAAMLGGGAGQTVMVGPVYINQELDWEALRWRLQELTRRRG